MNILGTDYTLIKEKTILPEMGADGECFIYDKIIRIRPQEMMLSPEDSFTAKQERYDEVLRHEIIHAFFNESGLDKYTNDEQLVDWIATQFPKIKRVFEECDCLK